jgi:DNA-binding PadR family transcriptional regulator
MASITPDETILGLLAAQTRHGYELLECFRNPAQLGEVWNLSTSQLYAVLKRLDQQDLIVGREIRSENAPPRMEYCLTEAGVARLNEWLNDAQPSGSIRRVRVEFLSRLYIARLLNIPTISIVKSQKASCHVLRESLIAHRDQSAPGVGYLAVELVIAQLDAVLKWIDRCELVPKDTGEEEDED